MMGTKYHTILIIDDNPADANVLKRLSAPLDGGAFKFLHELTPEGGRTRLAEENVDCLLLDYQLGDTDGISVLKEIRESGNDVPVVAITGVGCEQVAVDAMKLKAQDYLIKGEISPYALNRAILGAIERVSLERKNREQREELEAFAGMVSHDLNNPLRQIKTYVAMLKQEAIDLNVECKSYLDSIEGISKRATTLISSLLEYTRHGRSVGELEEVDLDSVLADVLVDLSDVISSSNARVDIAQLPIVVGDPVGLQQIFQNLICNGIKYNKSEIPTITISAHGQDQHIAITVADNGIGMEQKYLGRIFDPLRRLHTQQEYEGAGLGLATVKRIVEQHGGSIAVESTPGQGSTFRITLSPIPKAKAQTA